MSKLTGCPSIVAFITNNKAEKAFRASMEYLTLLFILDFELEELVVLRLRDSITAELLTTVRVNRRIVKLILIAGRRNYINIV